MVICLTCGTGSEVQHTTPCRGGLVCDRCVEDLLQKLVDDGRFKGLQWFGNKIKLYFGKPKK